MWTKNVIGAHRKGIFFENYYEFFIMYTIFHVPSNVCYALSSVLWYVYSIFYILYSVICLCIFLFWICFDFCEPLVTLQIQKGKLNSQQYRLNLYLINSVQDVSVIEVEKCLILKIKTKSNLKLYDYILLKMESNLKLYVYIPL